MLSIVLKKIAIGDIIHGDVKPQNALVFPGEFGEYRVKAIDFGYSARYEQENDRVKMFTTPPWTAPEYRSNREWTYSQAVQLDIFSFGLLCFWLLFEHYLSGIKPMLGYTSGPPSAHASALHALQSIKEQLFTGTLIGNLLENEGMLDENQRESLREFFVLSLKENPQDRAKDMLILMKMLHPSL
jgi:serine/threonine protein kinase